MLDCSGIFRKGAGHHFKMAAKRARPSQRSLMAEEAVLVSALPADTKTMLPEFFWCASCINEVEKSQHLLFALGMRSYLVLASKGIGGFPTCQAPRRVCWAHSLPSPQWSPWLWPVWIILRDNLLLIPAKISAEFLPNFKENGVGGLYAIKGKSCQK